MKVFLGIVLLAAAASAAQLPIESTSVYGYLERSIAEGERIRQAEEKYLNSPERVVGGSAAAATDNPWQAGLLIDMMGIDGTGICGASLISTDRLITAAHCWYDGRNQAWRFTVVLGSNLLFTGGTRVQTSAIAVHPNWFPLLVRNDIAVIYLPTSVPLSATIQPVSLPVGDELLETYAGETARVSGFGLKADGSGIPANQYLSQVNLNVITNSICGLAFPGILQDANICTSGIGGVGPCSGDSGGPLVITRNNRNILIASVSFGSALGCSSALPAVYVRTTAYAEWINSHI